MRLDGGELPPPAPAPAPHQARGPIRSQDAARLAAWVGMRAEGERNRGLFWASCRLAEAGLSLPEMVDALAPAGELAGLRNGRSRRRSALRSAPRTPSPRPSSGKRCLAPAGAAHGAGALMSSGCGRGAGGRGRDGRGRDGVHRGRRVRPSFTALADLARRSGVDAGQAWAWPLIVDGIIVVATVAVVALGGQRSAWYPWLLLAAGRWCR